jgi:Lrp/AsnC family leucine-responsive transcriptional regulator
MSVTRTDQPTHPPGTASPRQAPSLDEHDLAILRLLVRDARMSHRAVARDVGMSAPAVGDRIARLERVGLIRGYRADVDHSLLGYALVVYVGVVAVQGGDQPAVVRALRELPEVEDVHVVTGPKDLLVRLRLRDHEHLKTVLFDRIWSLPGIQRTETYISLGQMEPKDSDSALLDSLSSGEAS